MPHPTQANSGPSPHLPQVQSHNPLCRHDGRNTMEPKRARTSANRYPGRCCPHCIPVVVLMTSIDTNPGQTPGRERVRAPGGRRTGKGLVLAAGKDQNKQVIESKAELAAILWQRGRCPKCSLPLHAGSAWQPVLVGGMAYHRGCAP